MYVVAAAVIYLNLHEFPVLFQIRVGVPFLHIYSPEKLLYKYGVDLHFQAHEHSYERMWPVYNMTVREGGGWEYWRPAYISIETDMLSFWCNDISVSVDIVSAKTQGSSL